MNTIGKILVVLNFLFAIIVGGLLVVDFASRNKWKEAYEDLKRTAEMREKMHATTERVIVKITSDFNQAQNTIGERDKTIKENDDAAKARESNFDLQIVDLKNQVTGAETTLIQTRAAKQRLANEIEALNKTIKDREVMIVKLEADVKTYRLSAINFEALANARQIQNENLLEQLQEKTRKIARLESGVNPDTAVIRNPNEPNPPAVLVNGKVEKVDKDLVQISLGTDQGVNKNNTLDVYRTNPEAKYLGMVRIVDANAHKSVARFIVIGNAARPQLKEGDLVTSKLTR